jgi:hypothetical protein
MKHLIGSLALVVILSGCNRDHRIYQISDVTQAETITLEKEPDQENIYSWLLTGSGTIDGTAEVVVMLNGEPYLTEQLSGNVDFQWAGDWYADQAEIRYIPTSVTGGNLSLSYQFYGAQ